MCHLQHKTLPPHFEFIQLEPNTSIKKSTTLSNMKMYYQLKKNDSQPILVNYNDDQFILRILDTVTYTPLGSFSFQSVSSFLNKIKKPIKNKV